MNDVTKLGNVTFSKNILVCKLWIALLSNLVHPNFSFIGCVKDDISIEKIAY